MKLKLTKDCSVTDEVSMYVDYTPITKIAQTLSLSM